MLNLPSPASRPTYDRNLLKGGVVHVGVGRFHRAHQVPAFETLAEHGDYRWGIVGASLRSPAVRDRLRPQDYLYGLIVDDGQTRRSEVLGSLLEIIVAGDDRDRLLGAIASPDAHIVTVTVTEKGYKLDPASGALLTDDAAIRGDLANLASPRTLPGYLVAGLRRRKEHGLGPLTIISCDNMADNGHKLRSVVVEVARAHDPSLGEWIEERCCFPNTMVDRIVPAMTESDLDSAAALLKLIDRASVRTEPFMQWVIEDAFASARPELERAGVQFTANVAPWERAKLRLLNGAHSVMAYVGGLAGISTVHEFVAQPWARELLDRLWDEVQPTLATSTELNLADYRDQLMRRFANSALKHRLMQIAMDGSQKLPQRLVAPAVELIDKGHSPRILALGIAAWMRWQSGRNDLGHEIAVDDPISSTTRRIVDSSSTPQEQAMGLFSLASVFPRRLRDDFGFTQLVTEYLANLQQMGAAATAQRLCVTLLGSPEGRCAK